MTKLSPPAQAVLEAVCDNTNPDCDTQHIIAAALRAATKQSVFADVAVNITIKVVLVDFLLAIAAELEQAANTNTTETP